MLVSAYSVMLNIMVKNRYPYLVPDIWKRVLSVTIKYDIVVDIFVDALYHVREVSVLSWILSSTFPITI